MHDMNGAATTPGGSWWSIWAVKMMEKWLECFEHSVCKGCTEHGGGNTWGTPVSPYGPPVSLKRCSLWGWEEAVVSFVICVLHTYMHETPINIALCLTPEKNPKLLLIWSNWIAAKTTLTGSTTLWGNYPCVRQTALWKKMTLCSDQGPANRN